MTALVGYPVLERVGYVTAIVAIHRERVSHLGFSYRALLRLEHDKHLERVFSCCDSEIYAR